MSSHIDHAASRALRFARLSKVLVWLVGLAIVSIIGLFLGQVGLFNQFLPGKIAPPPIVTNPDQVTAIDATVNGHDRENQPYEVTAARGWQDEAAPNLVHLETVNGRFRRASGAEYTLSAANGIYDTKAKTLDLAGDVVIIQKDRFTARMDKALVVVEEKRLISDVAVDVIMPSGSIRANRMAISDDGTRILFSNGVKAVFNAAPAKGDAKP